AHEKLNRLPLQSIANSPLEVEDGSRTTPERAVVQKSHLWIEQPKSRITCRPIQERSRSLRYHTGNNPVRANGPRRRSSNGCVDAVHIVMVVQCVKEIGD